MLVAFRTDASAALGAGHVMRCAALALALRRVGGRSVFLCAAGTGDLNTWLAAQGHDVRTWPGGHHNGAPQPAWQIDAADDAAQTLRALADLGARPDWLVIDHYGIEARWLAACRHAVDRVLLIDDLGGRSLPVDALLDVGLQAEVRQRRTALAAGAKRLFGPRHAVLRPEFAAVASRPNSADATRRNSAGAPRRNSADAPRRDSADAPPRLLACMGGSDPHDALATVLAAWRLLALPRPKLVVAVGAGSPHLAALRERCAAAGEVALHVQSADMAGLMAAADWFIGSAGGISWERCALGLPAVIGSTADNQQANLQALAHARTAVSIGDWADVSAASLAALLQRLLPRHGLRARMAARARRLVDGEGALRVALHLAARTLRLRPAVADDAAPAFAWRNAASTRRHSFDPRPLDLQAHMAWWSRTLADPLRALLVAQVGEIAVGVLRLDHGLAGSPLPARVSIYLDPRWVGLGLGPSLLEAGQRWAASRLPAAALLAEISPHNRASIATFESAGFVRSTRSGSWEWRA